uniref:Glycosyltransferase n=1 Tax=viral metagenome TaxID=1070528 RepID=A0A6C0HF31_9ZZZZ
MSQIQTKVLKQGTVHPRVISCSFFTMKDAYRSFEKYERHLQKFLHQVRFFKDFEVRVYTDDTGKDFALKVAKDPNVSVIHFDCPQFREGDGHIGTFGTFVRFLPLFEEHELTWSSDIDIPDNYFSLENSDKDFRIYTHLCYDRKVYGRKYTISAGRFISRHQLPRALLTRFLNKVLDGGYNNEIELLNKANKHKPPSPFPYGVDELFLNWPVYDWIKKRDFQVNILIDYVPAMLINYNAGLTKDEDAIVYQFYKTNDKKLIPKLIDIYRKKVPPIVDKYPCLQPLVDKLKNPSKIKNDFFERININSKDL